MKDKKKGKEDINKRWRNLRMFSAQQESRYDTCRISKSKARKLAIKEQYSWMLFDVVEIFV